MYGLIVKLTVVPGRRDEMIRIRDTVAKPLVLDFERIAVTTPVWGAGLRTVADG